MALGFVLGGAELVDQDKKIAEIELHISIQIGRQIPGWIAESSIKSVYKSKKILKFYFPVSIEISWGKPLPRGIRGVSDQDIDCIEDPKSLRHSGLCGDLGLTVPVSLGTQSRGAEK